MKTVLSLMLALVLCLGICACSRGSNASGATKGPTKTTEAPIETTEAPSETTENPDNGADIPSDTDWIAGAWTTVVRYDDREHGEVNTYVNEITYGFSADGTGSINDYGWIGRPGEDWEIAGMGFVETYFIYTLEGDILTITHTGNEFEEYPEEYRETVVYTVVRNQDGSITWIPVEGRESRVYRQVEYDLTVEELLLLFGLNPNVPES